MLLFHFPLLIPASCKDVKNTFIIPMIVSVERFLSLIDQWEMIASTIAADLDKGRLDLEDFTVFTWKTEKILPGGDRKMMIVLSSDSKRVNWELYNKEMAEADAEYQRSKA